MIISYYKAIEGTATYEKWGNTPIPHWNVQRMRFDGPEGDVPPEEVKSMDVDDLAEALRSRDAWDNMDLLESFCNKAGIDWASHEDCESIADAAAELGYDIG